MPHLYARTDPEVVAEILRRRRAGEPAKAIAIDLGIDVATVHKHSAHLPVGQAMRDARLAAILAELDAGKRPEEVVRDVPGASFRVVMRIANASARDPDYGAPAEDEP